MEPAAMDDAYFENIGADNGADQEPTSPPSEQAKAQSKKRKNEKESEANKKPKVQENRAIYITNLPLDTDEAEVEEEFKKFGIIDQGADGKKRIKLYTNDEGDFNGEALVVYFKKESIALAIQMMDDYWFRPTEQSNGTIRVKEADFSYKKNKDVDTIASKLTRKDRKASERNRADLNRKLTEWSDDEEEKPGPTNKWNKTVVLKHTFTPKELEEDPAEILNIKEDIREEAETFGEVTNVTLYDLEEDGVITVKFREFEDAEAFRAKCDGRFFAHRKLVATLADDKPKFKKTAKTQQQQVLDSEDEERLEQVAAK